MRLEHQMMVESSLYHLKLLCVICQIAKLGVDVWRGVGRFVQIIIRKRTQHLLKMPMPNEGSITDANCSWSSAATALRRWSPSTWIPHPSTHLKVLIHSTYSYVYVIRSSNDVIRELDNFIKVMHCDLLNLITNLDVSISLTSLLSRHSAGTWI